MIDQYDGEPMAAGKYCPADKSRAWIELDRTALTSNIALLRSILPKRCRLMPAVKANAYGHGAVLISRECSRLGIDSFCVACAEEGAALRQAGIQGVILILGYTHPDAFPLLARYDLTQTLVDYPYALLLEEYAEASGIRRLPVHLAVDTGMHRLGVPAHQREQLKSICGMKHLRIDGVFSHLGAADLISPQGKSFTQAQIETFMSAAKKLREFLPEAKLHLQSSYGILNHPELTLDYARPGIALYGMLSTEEDTRDCPLPLAPVLSLYARVASLREIRPGETAGYGLRFQTSSPRRIAALSIGYGDGLPRGLSNGAGEVLLSGRRAPIVSPVCMDQTLVDVTDIPEVTAGSIATLIGRDGGEQITACELARRLGTISNEILSRLGSRLPRTFS